MSEHGGSYHLAQTPSSDGFNGPEFKTKRSPLDVKAPAHSGG